MVKLFVLQQAERGPVYGGALGKTLRNLGYAISPGSLYPLLHALEKEQLLHTHTEIASGRIRKYYQLTDCGKSCLTEVRGDLAGLVEEVIFDKRPCRKELQ
jgi:DNA-binding PadR family transcriptional regulator